MSSDRRQDGAGCAHVSARVPYVRATFATRIRYYYTHRVSEALMLRHVPMPGRVYATVNV